MRRLCPTGWAVAPKTNKQEVRWDKEDTVRPRDIFCMEKKTKTNN